MTINGGTAWAAATQSYGKGSIQGQSDASKTASSDYTSLLQQASDTLMSTLDSDKSGTIDKAEFSQAAQALSEKTGKTYNDAGSVFGSIDSNTDGSISSDELMKALQQSRRKHAHGGHHRPKPEALETTTQASTTDTTQQSTSGETALSKIQTVLTQKATDAYSSNASTGSPSIFTIAYRMKADAKAFADASAKAQALGKAYVDVSTNAEAMNKANADMYAYSQALHKDSEDLTKAVTDFYMKAHKL